MISAEYRILHDKCRASVFSGMEKYGGIKSALSV